MILGTYSGATYEPVEQPKPQRRPHRAKVVEAEVKPVCTICGKPRIGRRYRCNTCASYFYQHGVDRTPEMISLLNEKLEAAKWCKNCGNPRISGNQRCNACLIYYNRHKTERPRHLWDEDFTCNTCKIPLGTVSEPAKGYCRPCYRYKWRYGKARPRRLWGIGECGWCMCGRPANYQKDGFYLCAICAEE